MLELDVGSFATGLLSGLTRSHRYRKFSPCLFSGLGQARACRAGLEKNGGKNES
jgi:hypothetical protein